MNNNGTTYVAVRFSVETVRDLDRYAETHNVPNRIGVDEYHCTALHSHTPVEGIDLVREVEWVGKPVGFDIFEAHIMGFPTNCLVLRFDSRELNDRHAALVKAGGTHDFPEYLSHITLSYDIGEYDIGALRDSVNCLPEIRIVEEFSEELKDVRRSESPQEKSEFQSQRFGI